MKFHKDLLWLDQERNLLLMGLEENSVLVVTGPLKKALLDFLKDGVPFEGQLALSDIDNLKKLFSCAKLLDDSETSFDQPFQLNTLVLPDGSLIETVDLENTAQNEFSSYEIFAKNIDPTWQSGPGGYDDDVQSASTTLSM